MFTAMSDADRPRAPAYLRIAVILGATCLLIGLSGLIWLPKPAPTPAFVRIANGGDLVPQIVWDGEDGSIAVEVGTPGREPGMWLFFRAPTKIALELQLVTNGPEPLVKRVTEVVLKRGSLFDVE
jgi:hypothetical protein